MSRVLLVGIVALVACGDPKPHANTSPPSNKMPGPPVARVELVEETTFGVRLRDPYRWMEKPENRKELHGWLKSQRDYTRRRLDRIRGLPALRDEMRRLNLGESAVEDLQRRGKRLFYKATGAGESVARLYVKDPDGTKRVVFDPTRSGSKEPAAIDSYRASPDGTLVAVCVSSGGAEIARLEVIDVATGKSAGVPAGPAWGPFRPSWHPDGKAVFYTQMNAAALKNPKLDKMKHWKAASHRVGARSSQDAPILGHQVAPGMPMKPEELPVVDIPVGSRWAVGLGIGARESARVGVARVADLGKRPIPWRSIAAYDDLAIAYAVHGDSLFLVTRKNAPNGRVVRVDLETGNMDDAEEVVPHSDRVIQGIGAARDALYVLDLVAGEGGLRSVAYSGGTQVHSIPRGTTPKLAAAHEGADGVLLGIWGWTTPFAYYLADRSKPQLAPIGLASTTPANLADIVVERVHVPSTGGVKVPMTILRNKKSELQGKRPTILRGYGGYGVTISPYYDPILEAWLRRGGVYAVCNVRGGGAKGRAWYVGGKGANKPNGVRDFVNCARYLVSHRYTTAKHIAGLGRSMGGVLVGRAITESPEAFGAAAISVGFLNISRVLAQSNGANQIAEVGDPRTPAGFRTLLKMDAYQNVTAGKEYPAVILPVGLNDQRVAPWMTAKFAARLQASGNRAPVLVRVTGDAGHGTQSTRHQRSDKLADMWAFFLHVFGHPDFRSTDVPAAQH